MQNQKTVVLGEASEESDNEEIALSDHEEPSSGGRQASATAAADKKPIRPAYTTHSTQQQAARLSQERDADVKPRAGNMFGSGLFASIGSSSSTLARLANYAPHNLLQATMNHSQSRTEMPPSSAPRPENPQYAASDMEDCMTPLHRSLFAKNRQLQASLIHLYKHPLHAASKALHSINQRLVHDQKVMQEVDDAMLKLKREHQNLDIKINSIA